MEVNNGERIILFEDQNVKLEVNLKDETVWLNRNQMAELFDRDVKTIGSILIMHLKRNYLLIIQLSQNLRQFKLRGNEK